jgi:hypothetical protein
MFEVSEGQSAPPRADAATPRGGAGATVLTHPFGFGGAAAGLGGCHLHVHSD